MNGYDRREIQRTKERYRPGMRVRLVSMDDVQAPPSGTEGTVSGVDDMGSIMVKWDNGSTLSLIPGEDKFTILSSKSIKGSNSIKGPLTYRQIYDIVTHHGQKDYSFMNMFDGDGMSRSRKAKLVSVIAQLCYTYGYEGDDILSADDAVYVALELLEEMTGVYWDPTVDEFNEIKNSIK